MDLQRKMPNLTGRMTNTIIALIGVVLILTAVLIGMKNNWAVILLSIGTSVLASAIVSGITSRYLINQSNIANMVEQWGIDGIYKARAEINLETNKMIDNTNSLDICAMGLKSFRDAQDIKIKKRVEKGMQLRILTIDPDSKFLLEIDLTEGVANGSTKRSIESLLDWVSDLQKIQKYPGQVEIKVYDHYPYDFYFCLDGVVFTGPYQAKTSQQTITYKYLARSEGAKYYTDYFESLWSEGYEYI